MVLVFIYHILYRVAVFNLVDPECLCSNIDLYPSQEESFSFRKCTFFTVCRYPAMNAVHGSLEPDKMWIPEMIRFCMQVTQEIANIFSCDVQFVFFDK